eukprot:TRINITY_DN22696_c0_g1_i2.p1 TRINITY_DN22696_c0_g1~~TRINITY_DN22696_c0_g1_i2.p1  ORF type:complete len:367 (-),score=36.37 TRINITY_DN22696_c0_g1_i2:4-990(-)
MQTNAIAACCWEPHCCDHYIEILDACYIESNCQSLDSDMMKLIGVYHTVCPYHQVDADCPDQDLNEIPDKCLELNERLKEECGQRMGPMDDFIRPRDGKLASCCWPGTCCDLATEYYSNGCDLQCWVQGEQQKDYGSYVLGNGVAGLWKDICVIPEELSVCQSIESKDNVEYAAESSEQFVDFRAYAVPSEGITGPIEVLQPSPIQQQQKQQQYLLDQQQAQAYEQQQLKDAGICYETIEDYKNTEYGPDGSWTTTVRTFCNYTLVDLRSSPEDAIQLCCEVTQEMLKLAIHVVPKTQYTLGDEITDQYDLEINSCTLVVQPIGMCLK